MLLRSTIRSNSSSRRGVLLQLVFEFSRLTNIPSPLRSSSISRFIISWGVGGLAAVVAVGVYT